MKWERIKLFEEKELGARGYMLFLSHIRVIYRIKKKLIKKGFAGDRLKKAILPLFYY